MAQTVQTKIGSTQKFTEIEDIVDTIVLLKGSNACLVMEIQASNFSLLSEEEQTAKLTAYANLINSLSFPVQILIRNRAVDVTAYLKLLEQEEQKQTASLPLQNQPGQQQYTSPIRLYREFIHQLVSVNTVLDKKFYMIISYSYLEGGTMSVATGKESDRNSFITAAKASLQTKSTTLHEQLTRLSVKAKTLEKEELVKLFYDIYNPAQEGQGTVDQITINSHTPVVQLQKQ